MKNLIVCVGGTGQIVLHYYVQLYFLGIVKDPFDALIVDSDEIIPSLQLAANFLEGLQHGSQPTEALGAKVPVIKSFSLSPRGNTALQVLTGHRSLPRNDLEAASAFFTKDSLEQDVQKGLFARPALSSVLTPGDIPEHLLDPREYSTVVVAGSMIGGTGGGLTGPLMDRINQRSRSNNVDMSLRALLFGEYFKPDPGVLEGNQGRFVSNQLFVLQTIKESARDYLHSFVLIGGPKAKKLISRKPDKEKEGRNITWPEYESHPYWEGVQGLHYLLHDTVRDRKRDFDDREATAHKRSLELEESNERLIRGSAYAETIIKRKIPMLMRGETHIGSVWGKKLPKLIAHYWRIAIQVERKDFARAKSFPSKLMEALESVWHGEEDRPGMKSLFPQVNKGYQVTPSSLKKLPWPDIPAKAGYRRELFQSQEEVAKRAATTLLFFALRGEEE